MMPVVRVVTLIFLNFSTQILPSYNRTSAVVGQFKQQLKTFLYGMNWPWCIMTAFLICTLQIL